jgi:hypothetical protein
LLCPIQEKSLWRSSVLQRRPIPAKLGHRLGKGANNCPFESCVRQRAQQPEPWRWPRPSAACCNACARVRAAQLPSICMATHAPLPRTRRLSTRPRPAPATTHFFFERARARPPPERCVDAKGDLLGTSEPPPPSNDSWSLVPPATTQAAGRLITGAHTVPPPFLPPGIRPSSDSLPPVPPPLPRQLPLV